MRAMGHARRSRNGPGLGDVRGLRTRTGRRRCAGIVTMAKSTLAGIAVYAVSRQRGRCASCGRKIDWAIVVKTGKKMPFDAPVDIVATTEDFDGRVMEHIASPSHFA